MGTRSARSGARWRLAVPVIAAGLTLGSAALTATAASAAPRPDASGFNHPGDILIADQFNNRVIEINTQHQVVWHFGNGSNVPGPHSIVGTNDAQRVGSLTLIAGTGTPPNADPSCTKMAGCPDNRVILVNQAGQIVWQYGNPNNTTILNGAAFASRLPNGHTLITDSLNNRIIEVTHSGNVVWSFVTNTRKGSNAQPNPTRAVRLKNGNTLISDQFNHQVIEVNHAGHIVFSDGKINVPGAGFNRLNGPYDAKVVGDYTGLTPPFDD